MVLENLLDDTVVELGSRRRRYPKVILHHVVRGLRAERKLMVRGAPGTLDRWLDQQRAGVKAAETLTIVIIVFQSLYEETVKPQQLVKDPCHGIHLL